MGGHASRLTKYPGRVQGAHCPSHDGSEWCDGQRSPIPVHFGCSTIEKCRGRSMGRCALLLSSPYATPQSLRSGYNAPKNLQHYAIYLDTRIRTYRDLKHDAIRVQSETNRDMRLSMSLEEDGRLARNLIYEDTSRKGQSSGAPTRSKTIMGRKLRVMTVEKGLLRETKVVQKLLDALVECRVSSCFSPREKLAHIPISFIWMTWGMS